VAFCAAGLWLAAAVVGAGAGINFTPSTYNPAVGETVTFQVCQACLGSGQFRFTWEFHEGGASDLTTTDLSATHRFSQTGYVQVKLTARDASGRMFSRTKQLLVGDPSPLVAVRDASWEDNGTILVQITVAAAAAFSDIGLQETVPYGWAPQEVDPGNTLMAWVTERPIAVIWGRTQDMGPVGIYSYRLISTSSASGIPELSGLVRGLLPSLPAGEAQKPVVVTVCGDVTVPDD